jgi:hypothetical protein
MCIEPSIQVGQVGKVPWRDFIEKKFIVCGQNQSLQPIENDQVDHIID